MIFNPPLVEDFTGADGTINGRSVAGVTWASPFEVGDPVVNIAANKAGGAGAFADAAIAGKPYGPNLRIGGTLSTLPGVGSYVTHYVRVPYGSYPGTYGAGSTYFGLQCDVVSGASNDTVTARRFVAGAATLLTAVSGSNTGFDWAAGDTYGWELVEIGGGTLITALRNGVALCSWFDTTASRATAAGDVAIQVGDTTGRVDDLRIETTPSAPVAVGPARFALEAATDAPAVSPSFTLGYAWGKTSVAVRRRLQPKSQELASTIASQTFVPLGTNPSDTLCVQFVSGPLAPQLIRGHVKGIIRGLESATTANIAAQCIVYVCSADGSTLRKLLLGAQTKGATASPPEFAAALTNRKFPQSWATPGAALIPYACAAGDRMVVEIGIGQQSTVTAAQTLSLGSSAASNLAEDEAGTAADDPWFEFLAGLELASLLTPARTVRHPLLRR